MNIKTLKKAEKTFLKKYPGGFSHPEMQAMGKKHKIEKLEAFARDSFSKKNFQDSELIVQGMSRLVGRSSMVSMFEKPKFRDYLKTLKTKEKELFSESIYQLLHGPQKAGFESLVLQLAPHKLAKWPLVTVAPAYYRPQKEVFIKPTSAKLIVENLELDMEYQPRPSWSFYSKFRKSIKELKEQSDERLAPNNPAFCGFLMMGLGKEL